MENNFGSNLQILGLAGFIGIITKAILAPEKRWGQRLAQGIAGAACTIFLGPLVAHILSDFVDKIVYAWLASGFICGYGGETVIFLLQSKFLGGKK